MKSKLEEIKGSSIYMILEIILLAYNIYKFLVSQKISYMLLLLLVVIFGIHIYSTFKAKKYDIPNELKFMVEFCDSIGYTQKNKRNAYYDSKCNVDKIVKEYDIDGTSAMVQKEYLGRVTSSVANGIKVMVCAGSSSSSSLLNIQAYSYNSEKRQYIQTETELLKEDERNKIVLLHFHNVLAKGDEFKAKYVQANWDGAMRLKYDGVVIGEHLFFEGINEQQIILRFKMPVPDLSCELFQYNFKTRRLQKMRGDITVVNNKCTCAVRTVDIEKNCLVFLMYKYS